MLRKKISGQPNRCKNEKLSLQGKNFISWNNISLMQESDKHCLLGHKLQVPLSLCYGLNGALLNFYDEALTYLPLPPTHTSVTGYGVRKWLRLNEITWVGPWSHRISVPVRGNTRELKTSVTMSPSLYHVRTQWELIIWKSRWKLFSQAEPHLRLNLRLPASRAMRNTFLLFKPPCLWYWYFLMAAEQTQTFFDPVWRTPFQSLLF